MKHLAGQKLLCWIDITFKFDRNNFLCKLVNYMQVGTMYSSTYVLIMTALDRYMSICDPLNSQTWTRKRVHVMAAIAWFFSAIFSLPQLIIFSYKQRPDGVYDCMDNFDLQKQFWTLQAYITRNANLTNTGRNEALAQAEIAVLRAILRMALLDISDVMDITFKFDGNNFLCKLVKNMQVGTMYSSTYVLIMTALDLWVSVNAKATHKAVKRKQSREMGLCHITPRRNKPESSLKEKYPSPKSRL
ncbi:ANR-like protein [Mya arenaria]|uniref:ANR-like protein n=1 Tax=Mya arenaria TaxID=6604 RepID=A0ABY7EL09_MYAAR|nr:ANR-like protein [Mya arenaria]